MTHVEITDITGRTWVGDASDEPVSTEELDGLKDLLSNFKELNHLSIVIGGSTHYINPVHIVAVAVVTEAQR